MSLKSWKKIGSELLIKNPYITVEQNTYILPNGKRAEGYFRLLRSDYVLVLAFNEKREILVEKQYRWGVDDVVYELPAGWINKGEKPEDAAGRECEEETGFVIGETKYLGSIYAQPGFCNMAAHIVTGVIKKETSRKPDYDEEDLELEFISPKKVRELIKKGTIRDMGFAAAMTLFESKELPR